MGFMALKLDMSKAYDRVEWNFLDKIMERLGFNNKWRTLVGGCICAVSFSILVNGESYELSNLVGDFVKETLYRLTYFSYV